MASPGRSICWAGSNRPTAPDSQPRRYWVAWRKMATGSIPPDGCPDGTLGGYLDKHDRPPAFAGTDGAYYSVDLYLSGGLDPPAPIGGALLFVRWSDDGAQPVGHVETGFLTTGADESVVKSGLLKMSLHDVKSHLDTALEARKELPDW